MNAHSHALLTALKRATAAIHHGSKTDTPMPSTNSKPRLHHGHDHPGAALLSPAALAIIMTAFQGHQRAKALAAWGAVGGAGAAIGVLVGGLLTEFSGWRMIFYVNLPIAALLAIAALKIVPADTRKPRWRGLDLRGALLATTSLGAIVFAITQGERVGWTSLQTLLV